MTTRRRPPARSASAGSAPVNANGIGEARAVHVEAKPARAWRARPAPRLRRAGRRRPYSVALVIDSARGWTWWTSSRTRSQASSTASGVTLAPSPSTQHQLGAVGEECRARPPSSTSICASRWQRIAPCGGHSAASARQLAAVPVVTHSAATSLAEQVGKGAVEPLGPGIAVIGGVDPVGLRSAPQSLADRPRRHCRRKSASPLAWRGRGGSSM